MTQIVVHAGFHKTGTKTVQAVFATNEKLLSPKIRILLRDDMPDLVGATRGFSQHRKPWRLRQVGEAMAHLLERLPADDPRPVLLSSEDIAGLLPGRRGVQSYDALPQIANIIETVVKDRFGTAKDLTFFLSTRDMPSWTASAWWQHLRNTRLTLDLEAYRAATATQPWFDQIAKTTAAGLDQARLATCPLERSATLPHGPATPLLDLLGLSESLRGALALPAPQNARPDLGLEPVFLTLNQSGLPDRVVQETKRTLMLAARRRVEAQGQSRG